MFPTFSVPSTVKLPVILTSFSGITISPVPLALNSKSEFDSVVSIKLPVTRIFSNCTALALIIPLTSNVPLRL